jgi:dipeptidyl aminopeptidase/acylaminoacyl peptidase
MGELDERRTSYFGNDRSKYDERSPIAGLLKTDIPLMLAYAELEPPPLLAQSEKLVAALAEAGRKAPVIRLRHHNHLSIAHAINTEDTELSDAVLQFVADVG